MSKLDKDLEKVEKIKKRRGGIEQFNNRLTPEERKAHAAKAGKASVVARRKRKELREELLALLSEGKEQERICTALIKEAQEGNTKAFEIIRDTIGEKPKDKVDLTANIESLKNIQSLVQSLNDDKEDEDEDDE